MLGLCPMSSKSMIALHFCLVISPFSASKRSRSGYRQPSPHGMRTDSTPFTNASQRNLETVKSTP